MSSGKALDLSQVLLPSLVIADSSDDVSKKKLLEHMSQLFCDADPQAKYYDVLSALQQREKLGSTTLGHGIALPHARVGSLTKPLSALITLKNALNYDDEDHTAVDIIWGLIVPIEENDTHLTLLASISERLKHKPFRNALRSAKTNEALYKKALKEPA